MTGSLVRVVHWMSTDWPTPERCTLSKLDDGWEMHGEVRPIVDGFPRDVTYTVRVDREWQTRMVHVRMQTLTPPSDQDLGLARDAFGVWTATSGNDIPPLGGVQHLTDIDIQVTPATNTLPIRRLNLAVGESAEVTAAWFRIPEFQVEPLRQRYTRTADDTYHYESLDHDFTATLTVDDLGLVITYDPGWVRVTPTGTLPGQDSGDAV